MKHKQTDTGREFVLPRGALLVSTTGRDRCITYCNPAFVEASGYTRDDLVGQSLDLLDHPDMPLELGQGLWTTLDAGKPWSGITKSRRKNGEHFWVRSTIAPIPSGGYMIVRTPALRAQVLAADAMYAAMRNKAARWIYEIEATAGRPPAGMPLRWWPTE